MTKPNGFTAALAERTVVVTWPSNERGGATPPTEGWRDRAWATQPTLHEIDEGSVSGCSVLRWRDDPRSDSDLMEVSLALVAGKDAPDAPVEPPADRAALRDRIAEALRFWVHPTDRGEAAAAVLAVLPPPVSRADVYRDAADVAFVLDFDEQRATTHFDSHRQAWELGTIDVANKLRRMADEAQQDGAQR